MTRARFHLQISTTDGHIVESTEDTRPLDIELGTGEVHACIERLVRGMTAGERVVRRLSPADAFGEPEADRCVTLAREAFDESLEIEPGSIIEFDANGEFAAGTIISLDAESVQVDMNHPLAGHELDVQIELLSLTT